MDDNECVPPYRKARPLSAPIGINPNQTMGGGGGGGHTVYIFFGPPPASKVTQVLKKLMSGVRVNSQHIFLFFLKVLGKYSRPRVGVSSYITNLYIKQGSKKEKKKRLTQRQRAHMKKGPHINE